MIVISNAFTLTAEFAAIEGLPLIGWESLVITSNIVADTEEAEFPATNLANPSTYLKWVGADTTTQYLTVTTGSVEEIDYLAVARTNFGSAGIAVLVEGADQAPDPTITALLHFDDADVPTTITDSSAVPLVWTAAGNAQIDTAQFKFGTSSLRLDGTDDFISGDGSASFAFGAGAFTIDFWVRLNAVGIFQNLYDSRPAGTNGFYPAIYLTSSDALRYYVNGSDQISGATPLTTGVWYHIAVARSGTSTKLFLNGIQEGSTFSDSSTYINGASRPAIGIDGNSLSATTNAWIDELRVSKGTALWTANFTPPTSALSGWVELVQEQMPANDGPMLFQFEPQVLNQIRLRMASGAEPPEAAVVYVGKLLVVERSIKVDVDHIPIPLGRKTKVVNGMSESGNLLGRVVLHQFSESVADFAHINPDWYRTYFDPFVLASQETPFFWAWHPSTYPQDIGYVWLTKDPEPEANPVTQRMSVELEMRGVV